MIKNHRVTVPCVICGDLCETIVQHAKQAKCPVCKVDERNRKNRERNAGRLQPRYNANAKRIDAPCSKCGAMTSTTPQKVKTCLCQKCKVENRRKRSHTKSTYQPRFVALCPVCGKPIIPQCPCPTDVEPQEIPRQAYRQFTGKAWDVEPMYWQRGD